MAVTTRQTQPEPSTFPQGFRLSLLKLRYMLIGMVLAWLIIQLGPVVQDIRLKVSVALNSLTPATMSSPGNGNIAPLFTDTVQRWSSEIEQWGREYQVDPNLLATVMQIESCGHPSVVSSAGAVGLFQVMPFHFQAGERASDPATNAMRSASFLKTCGNYANGDPGLAMACYNGGPRVTQQAMSLWPAETQRYYRWGTAIYEDARANASSSERLDEWLSAGGSGLCQRAAITPMW